MTKTAIIQFLPFFPPHKGGLESHAQQRAKRRTKKNYGKVINITSDIGQKKLLQTLKNTTKKNSVKLHKKTPWDSVVKIEPIIRNQKIIWYKENGYDVYCIPSFEIIPTFVCYKFRSPQFKHIKKTIKQLKTSSHSETSKNPDNNKKIQNTETIIITRTRFFLTSLIWWLFAKRNKIPRTHIEHGVDYVKLNTKRKNMIARLYDQIFGRLVFRLSDQIIGVSEACTHFANKFSRKKTTAIYRGVEFHPKSKNTKKNNKIHIGFVGRLAKLKGVDILLKAIKELKKEKKYNFNLQIVGDGEEKNNLKNYVQKNNLTDQVQFFWFQNKTFLENEFLPNIDITVNASYQEWLPTSVIEWLLAECVVVATDVGGTKEISDQEDLILCQKGSVQSLKQWLEKAFQNHKKLQWLSQKTVQEKFNREKNIQKYYKILKKS